MKNTPKCTHSAYSQHFFVLNRVLESLSFYMFIGNALLSLSCLKELKRNNIDILEQMFYNINGLWIGNCKNSNNKYTKARLYDKI